ncbi:28S ribosomal protein S18b mitochondrial [Fasciolopsis buskii]|uniref:28S ribosomal protein S18b mitochondrial n=1 Tax=Fasciolopsis buskii TaxID=27845 RepID=A0A8E0S5B2_9TREM|nr:28S ribosomal protein S18b mitochondrial [Fasciolopsis buski]
MKNSKDAIKSDLMETVRRNSRGKLYNPVDLATSLDYMNSTVYQNIYRGKPVWFYYRRNFKGHFPPPKTRKKCVIGGKLITSNPCPICRDEYLVIDFRVSFVSMRAYDFVFGSYVHFTCIWNLTHS